MSEQVQIGLPGAPAAATPIVLFNSTYINGERPGLILPQNIASSTDATPIVITMGANHGYTTGDIITIANHLVNTNANGTWQIVVTGATTFALRGSRATGGGAGVATGTAASPALGAERGWLSRADVRRLSLAFQISHISAVKGLHAYRFPRGDTAWREVPITQLGAPVLLGVTIGVTAAGDLDEYDFLVDHLGGEFALEYSNGAAQPTTWSVSLTGQVGDRHPAE